MSLKQRIADRTIEGLFNLMSAPYFMRLSNSLWKTVNDRQLAKLGATADWRMVTDRLQRLEQRADQLAAKLEALGQLAGRDAGGSRS
jgi:hypothetical protein